MVFRNVLVFFTGNLNLRHFKESIFNWVAKHIKIQKKMTAHKRKLRSWFIEFQSQIIKKNITEKYFFCLYFLCLKIHL